MYGDLVSVIMPAYNCEKYISEAIDSVLAQTYRNLELVITDDCSTDRTREIIKRYIEQDKRVKYYCLNHNQGAAIARNNSIDKSNGEYLAFLDADDKWVDCKLEKQIKYMCTYNYDFTCTTYGKIDEESNVMRKVCRAHRRYAYEDLLKYCPGNSTIIYFCGKIGKIYGPNIKRRNDLAMFLKVIKITNYAYGFDEVLSYHRKSSHSLSANKAKVLISQWIIYYHVEKLGFFKAIYYLVFKIIQTLLNKNG